MGKETASIYIRLQSGDATKNIDNIAKAFTQARRKARLAERGSKEYIEQTRRVRELKGELDRHNKLLGRTGSAWSSVKNIAAGVFGGNLITSGIRLVGTALRNATQTVMNFQDANARLNSILGVTREQTAALREQQIQLGSSTAFTASQAADAQTELAKLGFTMSEITNLTPAVLDLAAASGTDLPNAAAIAGATLRQFGIESSEAQRVVDVMAKSFGSSALDIEKFSVAMAAAGPVAANAGVSMERTTALIGTLADRGLDASTAGTSLRNIFLDLSASGMTFEEAMNEVLTATDSNKRALELFGKRGATTAVILAKNAEAAGNLEMKLMDAGDAAKAMAEEQLNTLSGDLTKLSSAWEGFILRLENGEGTLAKVSRSFVKATADAVGFLSAIESTSNDSGFGIFDLLFGSGSATEKIQGLADSKFIDTMRTALTKMQAEADFAGLQKYADTLGKMIGRAEEGSSSFKLYSAELERVQKVQADLAAQKISGGLDPIVPPVDPVTETPTGGTTTTTGTTTSKTPEELRAEKAKMALEALKQSYEEEKLYLAEDRAAGLISEEQYQQELTALKMANLLFEKEALQALGEDTVSVEQQIADERIAIQGALDEARAKSAAAEQDLADKKIAKDKEVLAAEKARAEAAIQSATMSGAAATEGAESVEEGAKRALNAIRGIIKGYLAEALAAVVAKSLTSVPPPFSLVLAAASGAAASLLFDQLIPAFAKGTDFAPGGMALVGEKGPELVNLPRGSQVFTAPETQSMLASGNVFGSRFAGNTTPPPSTANQSTRSSSGADMEAVVNEIRSWQRELQVTFSTRTKSEFDTRLSEAEKPVKFKK